MTLVLVKLWLLVAAGCDLAVRRIPNALTLGVLALVLAYICLCQQTPLGGSLVSSTLGFSLALILTLPAYIARLLGAADVKLFAVIGLLGGLKFVLMVFIMAAISVLLATVVWRWAVNLGFLPARGAMERFIPFGAALALAASVLLWWPDAPMLGMLT